MKNKAEKGGLQGIQKEKGINAPPPLGDTFKPLFWGGKDG